MSTRARSAASCSAPAPTAWPAPRPTRRSNPCVSTTSCAAPSFSPLTRWSRSAAASFRANLLVDEASQCLRLLSGRDHRVYTAICLVTPREAFRQRLVRDAGALQAPERRTISKPISAPANGAARPMATRAGRRWTVHYQDGRLLHQHPVGLPLYESIALRSGEGFPNSLSAGSAPAEPPADAGPGKAPSEKAGKETGKERPSPSAASPPVAAASRRFLFRALPGCRSEPLGVEFLRRSRGKMTTKKTPNEQSSLRFRAVSTSFLERPVVTLRAPPGVAAPREAEVEAWWTGYPPDYKPALFRPRAGTCPGS